MRATSPAGFRDRGHAGIHRGALAFATFLAVGCGLRDAGNGAEDGSRDGAIEDAAADVTLDRAGDAPRAFDAAVTDAAADVQESAAGDANPADAPPDAPAVTCTEDAGVASQFPTMFTNFDGASLSMSWQGTTSQNGGALSQSGGSFVSSPFAFVSQVSPASSANPSAARLDTTQPLKPGAVLDVAFWYAVDQLTGHLEIARIDLSQGNGSNRIDYAIAIELDASTLFVNGFYGAGAGSALGEQQVGPLFAGWTRIELAITPSAGFKVTMSSCSGAVTTQNYGGPSLSPTGMAVHLGARTMNASAGSIRFDDFGSRIL